MMLGEILETITDIVERADRNITKLFSEPWPPLDTSKQVSPRVVYVKPYSSRTYHRSAQVSSHRVVHASTTLRPLVVPQSSNNRKTWPEAKSPRNRLEDVNRRGPKLRQPVTTLEQRRSMPARTNASSSRPSSSSSPAAVEKNKREQIRHALVKPVPQAQRRTQSLSLEDIRPDPAHCDVLVIAVAEMEICKELFAGWRAQLDLGEPRRKDKLELSIVSTVRKLDIGASAALHASHNLLRNYRTLLSTIERSLRSISQSKSGGGPLFSPEIPSLASTISAHSRALSSYVKQMQERLRTLVRDIEKTKESADKRALKRKIWKWLSRAFKVISALLSAGGAVFALLHPIGLLESAVLAGASMLSGAAARLCEIVQDKYNETTFDEILAFLRDHIPESTKAAEIALTSFQACHRVLQVELEVRKGKRPGWVSASDAERARDQWAQAGERLRTADSSRRP